MILKILTDRQNKRAWQETISPWEERYPQKEWNRWIQSSSIVIKKQRRGALKARKVSKMHRILTTIQKGETIGRFKYTSSGTREEIALKAGVRMGSLNLSGGKRAKSEKSIVCRVCKKRESIENEPHLMNLCSELILLECRVARDKEIIDALLSGKCIGADDKRVYQSMTVLLGDTKYMYNKKLHPIPKYAQQKIDRAVKKYLVSCQMQRVKLNLSLLEDVLTWDDDSLDMEQAEQWDQVGAAAASIDRWGTGE